MVMNAGLTARLAALDAEIAELETALRTVATGGQSVTIEGRTITRPNMRDLQMRLNAAVGEANRLRRLMVAGSEPMATVQLEQGSREVASDNA